MKNHEGVLAIIEELKKLCPEGLCSFQYPKPCELSFSVCLATQYTGGQVNVITPAFFARLPTLESLAQADPAEVKTYIHSTGFFRAEARDIIATSRMLVEQYSGRAPDTMEELLKLPGASRRTTNLILGDVYHAPGVMVADTRYIHITGQLGLTDGTKDPAKVEEQLRPILPPEESNDFCRRMVLHGRTVCMTHKSGCPNCTLRPWCGSYTKS